MSSDDVHTLFIPHSVSRFVFTVVLLALVSYFGTILYDAFFGPLSKFPGPKLRAVSKLPGTYTTITGRDAFVRADLHEKYGPVVRVNPAEISFNNGAEAWESIYGFKKPKPFRDPQFYAVGVNGCPDVVSSDEENHSRQRKILSTGFSDKAIKGYEPLLRSWAQKMITKMFEQANKAGEIDMLKYLNCTTFDVMGDLAFGEGLNMLEDGELSPWVQTIFAGFKAGTFWRCVMQYSTLTNWVVGKLLFSSKQVRVKMWQNFEYCQSRMDKRLSHEPDHPDLWSKAVEKSGGVEGLTVDEFHSNSVTFMVAGTETTATALSGLIYLLHQRDNRDALEKLKLEVRNSFASLEEITLDSLSRLDYLQTVLQEGLRLYPPAPSQLPRRTPPEGMLVCGQYIPGGITVAVHPLGTFMSPTHFKDPKKFRPERWLGHPDYKGDHLDAVEPFSYGPQNCLGKSLAWHEMRLLLASLILSFDIELTAEAKGWIDQNIYVLWEKKPLMCTLRQLARSS
ncbi:hypothetical protein M409DRAFT_70842 [Zasmidium cellare ATCC 36951]|uniref:Cytochrome P450 monooxygenase n=1 Tax=Zasmidium cellare ATCC 36951 TaxID=1080233 RepID=A0A6A6BYY4_ZASCE|nr:uncharacterized protein M409DRAFT_70842 [Zasmidium cellare ATCC 36951]KAF2159813.1 hypothetical protein M409DRAFT_70842 [Zasmidium cellare ATCC 36951]